MSYWTIRGRLNELIATMGLGDAGDDTPDPDPAQGSAAPPPAGRGSATEPASSRTERATAKGPTATERQAILDRLKRGEITATEAAAILGGN